MRDFKSKIGNKVFSKKIGKLSYSDKEEDTDKDVLNTAQAGVSGLIRFSDKVFDQARYHFERRQKKEFDRKISYYERLKPNKTERKFSEKLVKSKEIKIDPKLEKLNNKLKTAKGDEKQRLIKERKAYVNRMNERMQFEKRYTMMRKNLYQVKKGFKLTARDVKRKKRQSRIYAILLIFAFLGLGGCTTSAFALSSTTVVYMVETAVVANCWGSLVTDVDKAEDYFNKKAEKFKLELNDITDPECDEVVKIGAVTYDRFKFISYLEAAHNGRFNYEPALEIEMDRLFDKIFSYYTIVTTKTKTVIELNTETGEYEPVEKEVKVLEVHIRSLDFDEYAYTYLDEKQRAYYTNTMTIHGGLQMFNCPYDGWQSSNLEYYTLDNPIFRITTVSNQNIYALRDGTVTEKGDDYVVVECEEELSYKLSEFKDITVNVGDSVTRGEVIGKSKHHLYVEVYYKGTQLNPLFYMQKE